MTTSMIYLENDLFSVGSNIDTSREHPSYQKIKTELKRQVTPFSGGIDWPLIIDETVTLAKESNVGIEVALYYLVGNFKVSGLSGFGNGLELLYFSLSSNAKEKQQDARQYEDLFKWANQQAIKELSNLRCGYEMLRELYRIERLCERISYLVNRQYPQLVVDFETLGFAIFEHIDAIETSYQSAFKKQGVDLTPVVKVKTQMVSICNKGRLLAAFLGGIVLSGFFFWAVFQLP